MRTIFKYPLEVTERQTLMLPAHAELLTIASQYGKPCIWALVDTDVELKPCEVFMCGTGMPCCHARSDYLGTVQMASGRLVLHVFIRRK